MRYGSKKLKRAVAEGRVVVENTISGEVQLFLRNSSNKLITVIIDPKSEHEIAPRYVPCKDVHLSPNLDVCLRQRSLRIV